MTIGRNSRMGSVRSSIRTPKFLDKASGFYGRLDEPEVTAGGEGTKQEGESGHGEGGDTRSVHGSGLDDREECDATDLHEGVMEDDGETLLRRKPSRLSSRWRRSSRRKQKERREEAHGSQEERSGHILVTMEVEEEQGKTEPVVVHFQVREEEDDQVLIRDKKRGREEEEEEERRMRREQEEGMKMVKRKNYRKALDRAFRRGWEAFLTNLYSVTLTPMASQPPSSPAPKRKLEHSRVLAELRLRTADFLQRS